MKKIIQQKFLTLILLFFVSGVMYAQPSNDDCSTPTLLAIGADAESCVPVAGDTRGTVNATTVPNTPSVCSGSWYTDDVWYSIETGLEIPENGVTIEVRLDPTSGTELMEHGMAIYADCDASTTPIDCFSDIPGRRTIAFPAQCLAPNSSFLIRIWSAPETVTFSGTFSICAFESPAGPDSGPQPRIVYEETFDAGFGDWSLVSETSSLDGEGNTVEDNWMWSNTGCFPNAFGGEACLTRNETACTDNGVVGIPAGWFQSDRNGNDIGGFPYPDVIAYIVSPPIDLSKEACVNLTWIESHRGLNGSGISRFGPFVQYSLDGGDTWINPSQAINSADVSTNYGGTYVVQLAQNAVERSIPIIGAERNSDVRIRFGYDGDLYYWIVDEIRIVEGTASDAVAQNNFFARSHINPMSIHQIDSYDFLIDVANLACEDQENLSVNVTGINAAGEEVHNVDLAYGTIESDSLAENQSFLQPFTPSAEVDNYTFTYTVSSDRDDDLSNNQREFTVDVVDETVFRKEDGQATGTLNPNTVADVFWAEGEPFTWEIGNMFFATSATSVDGQPLIFNDISFEIGNPGDLIGDVLRVWLYKIEDNDFDGIISKDDNSEITRLGFSQYTITGIESGLITIELEPFLGNANDLIIDANTHYLASIETTTDVIRNEIFQIANNTNYAYNAALFNARQNANSDLTKIRYGHAYAITKQNYLRISPSTTGDLTTGNFNENFTPVIRLGYRIDIGDSTVEINDAISMAISPNPTAGDITLQLSIDQATNMDISIVDLTGRVVVTKSFEEITELRENFNLNGLSNGVYMVHVSTVDGIQTEKFIINK